MKKSLLTLAFAVGLLSASAQVFKAPVVSKSVGTPVEKTAKVATISPAVAPSTSYGKAVTFTSVKEARKAAKKAASFSPMYHFDGALYDALYDDGYYSYKLIYTPALTDATFNVYGIYSLENPVLSWTLKAQNDADVTASALTVGDYDATFNGWGYYYVPELTVSSGDESASYYDTFTYNGTTYQAYMQAGCDSVFNISNAWPVNGLYGYFTDGPSFTINDNFYETGKKLVGVGEYYVNPGDDIYAEGIYAAFRVDGTLNEGSPLDGKTITATIVTFDEEGNFVPYATATASDADVVDMNDYHAIYTINFKFVDNDDILGEVEAPIMLPKEDFFVLITGLDQVTSVKYQAAFGSAKGFDGNGYALLEDGSISTIPYSNSQAPQVNLNIGFINAALPVAKLDETTAEVVFPVEGGYGVTYQYQGEDQNDIDIITAFPYTDFEIVEAPDWVTDFEYDDSYQAQYGILAFFLKAEALPAGTEGRSGEVVFATNFNKEVVVKVKQGAVTEGIDGVKISGNASFKNGATFNLAGQRVSKDFKGIVIRDGKKFIQK